jgi:hypothetical protein
MLFANIYDKALIILDNKCMAGASRASEIAALALAVRVEPDCARGMRRRDGRYAKSPANSARTASGSTAIWL